MNIGIVIARIGGEDGVALETEKWITVLGRMGHRVCVLAGDLESDHVDDVTLLPGLALDHPLTVSGQRRAFLEPAAGDEGALLADLEREADELARGIQQWIDEQGVECLIAENACALPCHLTMGMALRRVFEDSGLPAVTHDHDFAWERGERYHSPHDGVQQIVEQCFPVKLPEVRHAVINSAARDTLAGRFGIDDAVVVPNVMDFDDPIGAPDAYNASLLTDLGLSERHLVLFQVTRVIERKGIETAIELVARLADPRVQLVITGSARDDDTGGYTARLQQLVHELELQEQVHFAGDRFDNFRGVTPDGRHIYSLSDAYARATACTYFSTYEGFGNAFVEAVVARRPIFVNNYEPVYWRDIGSRGFEAVMLEDRELSDAAVARIAEILASPRAREQIAEHNFELGRQHFSYPALQRILTPLF